MRNTLKGFKVRALARPDVRRKYEVTQGGVRESRRDTQGEGRIGTNSGLTVRGYPASIHSGSVMDTI